MKAGRKVNSDVLIKLNRYFRPVTHPFNLESAGEKTYSEWEFEKGADTVRMYLDSCVCGSEKCMFSGKTVLDVGAGGGGKSLYYLSRGAKHVTALDVIERYKNEAIEYAVKLGLNDNFTYCVADASKLPFEDESFDLVIMNDSMEHVKSPEMVLNEVTRVLKTGGRLCVNFPPYGHPFGAHLSDVISIPWVHLFFDEQTLIDAYKKLVSGLSDSAMRVNFRISTDNTGKEYFSYINKLTIKRFRKIIAGVKMKTVYYREVPLRGFLSPLAHLPWIKECMVKAVVCIMEKQVCVQ